MGRVRLGDSSFLLASTPLRTASRRLNVVSSPLLLRLLVVLCLGLGSGRGRSRAGAPNGSIDSSHHDRIDSLAVLPKYVFNTGLRAHLPKAGAALLDSIRLFAVCFPD